MPRLFVLITAAALAACSAASVLADEPAEIRALLARGDAAAALQRAQKAAAADARDVQSRFLVGVAQMDLGRNDEALALFTRMSQDYPELPDPFNNIAMLQARVGRLDAAKLALESALRNDPAHRVARANLGQIYLLLAVQAWEQAAATGPLDPPLQRKLEAARALASTGVTASPMR